MLITIHYKCLILDVLCYACETKRLGTTISHVPTGPSLGITLLLNNNNIIILRFILIVVPNSDVPAF